MKIYEGTYKDIEAVIVETAKLKACFLPKYGAKLTSLKDIRTGREFMAENPGETYQKLAYGGSYVNAECSAFDDMFPTIDPFICNDYPWKGAEYPDHGEVCALKWHYEILEESLHMWVYSVRFGYRMDKWVEEKDGTVVVRYQVENLTEFNFNGFYAAHCMLQAEEGMEIKVPYKEGAPVTTAFCHSGKIGTYGSKGNWPVFNEVDLSRMPSRELYDNYKIFFDEPAPEGWCELKFADGNVLKVGFDQEAMPHMCIWYNLNLVNGLYNVALEPGTGSYDRPDIARLNGKNSILHGYEKKQWFISFS